MSINAPAAANAVPAAERLEVLDALRGFALLGILLANMWFFIGWDFMSQQQMIAQAGPGWELAARLFHKGVIDGKFYTLFSLIFGIGFTLQLDRLEKRGVAGRQIFRRRMLVMLLIGLIHLDLIWAGDILTLYACMGLLLPLFRQWSERKLLIAALALLALPLVTVPIFAAEGWKPWNDLFRLNDACMYLIDHRTTFDPLAQMQRPDTQGWAAWQFCGLPGRIAMLIQTWRIPKVLGIMLIGMAMGRRLVEGRLIEDRKLLTRTFWLGFLVGAPLSLLYALNADAGQDHWTALIGTAPLGLAYAAGFVLLWPHAQGLLRHLAPVGRMALTNYITHSLIGVLMLGRFTGLIGHVPPWQFYPFALAIYAAQVVISPWWLARHEQGPLEKLWRWGTYGGRLTARKALPVTSG
jgi:uncharacterized protein